MYAYAYVDCLLALCGSVVNYLLGVVFVQVSDVLHVVDADGAIDVRACIFGCSYDTVYSNIRIQQKCTPQSIVGSLFYNSIIYRSIVANLISHIFIQYGHKTGLETCCETITLAFHAAELIVVTETGRGCMLAAVLAIVGCVARDIEPKSFFLQLIIDCAR